VYNFPKVTFPEREHLKFESRSFGSLWGNPNSGQEFTNVALGPCNLVIGVLIR
jgi:hypothetical protein